MALEFHFVLALLLVYGTSYLFKYFERYDIPILLVEIIAGIVFGSVLGVVDEGTPGWEFFTTLAAFGLLVIMFEAGLELDPKPVLKRPKTVAFMSVTTFLLPFLADFGFGQCLGDLAGSGRVCGGFIHDVGFVGVELRRCVEKKLANVLGFVTGRIENMFASDTIDIRMEVNTVP